MFKIGLGRVHEDVVVHGPAGNAGRRRVAVARDLHAREPRARDARDERRHGQVEVEQHVEVEPADGLVRGGEEVRVVQRAVAVSRDDALDVLAAACHTHAPERLPAWRRAEEANARGGTSASEVDLDALLATLVDAWARGEAPADWAKAPKRRRADERPEPTVVVPRVSKRLSTRTETG